MLIKKKEKERGKKKKALRERFHSKALRKQHTQQHGNAGAFAPQGGELLPANLGGEVESRWPGEEILDTATRGREVTGSLLLICSLAERLTRGQRKPSIRSGRSLPLRAGSARARPSPQFHGITRSCSARDSLAWRHLSPGSFSGEGVRALKIRGPHLAYGEQLFPKTSCFSPITLPLKTKTFSKQIQSCFKVLLLFPAEDSSTGLEAHLKA